MRPWALTTAFDTFKQEIADQQPISAYDGNWPACLRCLEANHCSTWSALTFLREDKVQKSDELKKKRPHERAYIHADNVIGIERQ